MARVSNREESGTRARAIWSASEPFVLGLLFAQEGRTALSELGIQDRSAYFAVRAAPLGRAEFAVVAAALHGFPVVTVEALLQPVWERVSPADVISTHRNSVAVSSERIFGREVDSKELEHFADMTTGLGAGLDTSGRPLAAANRALPAPEELWARLWHAATVLREYRGDGHIAALVAADVSVAESLVLTAAWAVDHIDATMLRTSRQLSASEWSGACSALARRGFMTEDGTLTLAGKEFRDDIESRTDDAAQRPWGELTSDEFGSLYRFMSRLSATILDAGVIRAVTPVGAPWPPVAATG